MSDFKLPKRLAIRRATVLKWLGDNSPDRDTWYSALDIGNGCEQTDPKTAISTQYRAEVDNLHRQSSFIEKKDNPHNSSRKLFKLTDNGWLAWEQFDQIEIVPTRIHTGGRSLSKKRPLILTQQTPLQLEPIYTASIGATAVTKAVDELIKENVSLRLALIHTMKNQLIELNKTRLLLGYEEITNKDLPENRSDNDE